MSSRWFDHFSLIAPIYDRFVQLLDTSRLEELLGLPIGGRLLDAGGGTGRVSGALRGQVGEIVVIDVSAGMVQQSAYKDGLQAVRGHAECLPFPAGSFERILVVDAFHHFCDQGQAAADLWRVLAPEGRLVVEEPNIEAWPVKLIALGERLALMRSRFYSPRDMREMFAALGARVEVHTDDEINAWVVADKR